MSQLKNIEIPKYTKGEEIANAISHGLGVILGIAYTIGAILYGIGKKHKYMHFVFHLFVLLGSILHFLCIYLYVVK